MKKLFKNSKMVALDDAEMKTTHGGGWASILRLGGALGLVSGGAGIFNEAYCDSAMRAGDGLIGDVACFGAAMLNPF